MIGVLLCLIVFVLCAIVILINLKYFFINAYTNVYFVLLTLLVGAQRLVYALSHLEIIKFKLLDFDYTFYFLLFIGPIYFLFLKTLLKFEKYNSSHFKYFIPFLGVVVLRFFKIPQFNSFLLVLTLVTLVFYLFCGGIILHKFYKTKYLTTRLNKRVFSFGLFSYIFLFLITLSLFKYIFISQLNSLNNLINLTNTFLFSTIIWFFWLVYLIMNPILLYGEACLISQINYNFKKEFKLWLVHPKNNLVEKSEADQTIEKQLKVEIYDFILEIKKLELDRVFTSQKIMSIDNISIKLKIPKYHLKYIFKYYCSLSLVEYQNFWKVNTAIDLINNDYLKTRTIDSLSKDSLFASRVNMYKYFKKFHNQTPLEYSKRT